ncbi:MAG: TraR/DksA C4-type zinc finger protein [Parcubacteria group bacterium]
MPIDKKIMEELRADLEREKTELESNLGKIARPVGKEEGDYETSFEDIGTDKDDNATEVDQYTQNLGVESTLEKKLQDIIEALERMDNGTYGLCENCQKEIPLDRLQANPSAKTCIVCN